MKNSKNLLFDLDGTIIDPKIGIVNAIVYALQEMGIEVPPKETLTTFIGPPLLDSFRDGFQLSEEEATLAVKYFRVYFGKQGVHENTLYTDIEQVLHQLKEARFRLFIATSKPTFFAEQIIQKHQLNHLFDGIVGSNLDNTRQHKTDVIDFVLTTYQLASQDCVMIGDRKYDIKGAKNKKLVSVGVSYGYGGQAELQEAQADYIVGNCLELGKLLMD